MLRTSCSTRLAAKLSGPGGLGPEDDTDTNTDNALGSVDGGGSKSATATATEAEAGLSGVRGWGRARLGMTANLWVVTGHG